MAITSHQNEQNQTKMVILNHKVVITGSCPSLGWPFAFKQMVESFPNPASDLDLGTHSIQINWREFPGWVDKGWIWKGPWCLSSVAGGQSVWGSTMVSLGENVMFIDKIRYILDLVTKGNGGANFCFDFNQCSPFILLWAYSIPKLLVTVVEKASKHSKQWVLKHFKIGNRAEALCVMLCNVNDPL